MSLTSYRAAPSRDNFASIICIEAIVERYAVGSFTRFGDDLLSHALRRSTIGATVLNCRVRDGTGCFTCAMITKPSKTSDFPSHVHVSVVYAFDYLSKKVSVF